MAEEPPGRSAGSQSAWDGSTSDTEMGSITAEIGKGSYLDQYQALLRRNFTIKRRDKRKTITEFVMPLYYIIILAIIRLTIPETQYDPITVPHGKAALMASLPIAFNQQTLRVAPNSTQVRDIIQNVLERAEANYNTFLYAEFYESEEDLLGDFDEETWTAAVVFPENPVTNKSYTLRFNPITKGLPSVTNLWSYGGSCRPEGGDNTFLQANDCPANQYFYTGFSALQTLIDTAIMEVTTNKVVEVAEAVLENFPKKAFSSNSGMILRNMVPLYMVFAWAQFIVYLLMLVVEEKEKKIKESMKMMGLRDSIYWLSWFSVYGLYVLVLAVICIIVLPVSRVFQSVNLFLLFLLFVLYGCSSIMLAFMITPFFNKAKVAGLAGNLLQISMSLLFYLQVYLGEQLNPAVFWALGLLSPCAFSLALDKVILFDYSAGGLSFDNIWEGPGLPFAGSLIMITVDIFIYLFLAFYLDSVVPSEYGTKRSPFFLCQSSFWKRMNRDIKFQTLVSEENNGYEDDGWEDNPDIEPVSQDVKKKIAVRIRGLKKVYNPSNRQPVTAVDGFSLNIYEGQITAILGHNGAGKTTLFNILTGMTAPTAGSASIFGMDIRDANDLTDIRRITGICPQHDVIFSTLTPVEHLNFFARVRGIPSHRLEEEVEQTLKNVDLYSKKDSIASKLSGGQKRKLSIGIAIVGDPKIIFLDEPTAGVDTYSRRKLWGLLRNKKEGKVILLTTHFMDEADILADRKVIMSHGRLRCCGSSLFLKNKFGLGYHLTLVVKEGSESEAILEFLQLVVEGVQLARYYGKEMSFVLPLDSTSKFPTLFEKLDRFVTGKEQGQLDIEGYGISMTTLEEVFLSLSEEGEEAEPKTIEGLGQQVVRDKTSSGSPLHTAIPSQPSDPTNGPAKKDTEGFALNAVSFRYDAWRAYKALVKTRFLGLIREPASIIFMLVVPICILVGAIALAGMQAVPTLKTSSLLLQPSVYGQSGALLHNATSHPLDSITSSFTTNNMTVKDYNGSYAYIAEMDKYMTAFDVDSFPDGVNKDVAKLTLRFNDTFMHSIPILVNLLSNSIFSTIGGNDSISVTSQALPLDQEGLQYDSSTFFSAMMIGFTYTFIPMGLTIDLVHDREIMARNLLRLNGVSFNLYFLSYYTVMSGVYLISYVALLITVAAFQVASLVIPPAFACLAILYLLNLPVSMLSSSVYCYMFDRRETAQQFYPSMLTTIGFLGYTAVSLVDTLVVVPEGQVNPALVMHIIFTILFPVYIPFGLLYYINSVYLRCSVSNSCGALTMADYMTPEIVVQFVMLVLDIPLYFILLRVADTVKLGGDWREALWMKPNSVKPGQSLRSEEDGAELIKEEDDDVKQERAAVAASLRAGDSTSPVLIHNLKKVYDTGSKNPCKRGEKNKEPFVAVRSLSLDLKPGQVFGLLGPNGAGKTTSLRIMTAEEKPTKGRVQICGEDIVSSLSEVFQSMGYCPQQDVVWRNITVAEHIECYANIRGINETQIDQLVSTYLKGLEIVEHKGKKGKNLSGGTKRKLSYIISMLGAPKVVFLDEPSTGMDPQSKRFLWNSILASFKQGDRSSILTTHSMEEADALCSSLGILVKGVMRCIGSVQYLKNKYGGGYNLEMKLCHPRKPSLAVQEVHSASSHASGTNSSAMGQVQALISELFPNSTVDEQFDERIIYKIPQSDVESLAQCFVMLEKAKSERLVEEYALSQTTLEQVFLQFARKQEQEEEGEGEEEEAASEGGSR